MNHLPGAGVEQSTDALLSQATCMVRVADEHRGTAWLIDATNHLLLTAGHVITREASIPTNVTVEFVDSKPYAVSVIEHRYVKDSGLDYAVLEIECDSPTPRQALPLSFAREFQGAYRETGYPGGEGGQSPAMGTYVGVFRRNNSELKALFRLESTTAGKHGFSGAAIFSESLGKIVGLHTEGAKDVVGAGRNTVLSLPLYRVAEVSNHFPNPIENGRATTVTTDHKQRIEFMEVTSMTVWAGRLAAAGFLLCLLLFLNFILRRSDVDLFSLRVPAGMIHLILGPILIAVNMAILVFFLGVSLSDVTKEELLELRSTEVLGVFGPLSIPFI